MGDYCPDGYWAVISKIPGRNSRTLAIVDECRHTGDRIHGECNQTGIAGPRDRGAKRANDPSRIQHITTDVKWTSAIEIVKWCRYSGCSSITEIPEISELRRRPDVIWCELKS